MEGKSYLVSAVERCQPIEESSQRYRQNVENDENVKCGEEAKKRHCQVEGEKSNLDDSQVSEFQTVMLSGVPINGQRFNDDCVPKALQPIPPRPCF
jgi:hypothetical protein